MAVKKYLSLEKLGEYDELIKGVITDGDAAQLDAAKTYTNTEVAKKADKVHSHDDLYYTESEVDTKISGVNSTITTHTGNGDIHVTAAQKTNWNSAYSHSTSAHAPSNAERNIIVGIQKNGTDLTVDSSRKVNITVPTTAADIGAATAGHNHDDKYDTKGAASTALDEAKEYTNTKTTNMATTSSVNSAISTHNTSNTAHGDIRSLISDLSTKVNNFLDVDETTTDQLSEVLKLIEDNKGDLESLTSSKVNVSDIVDNLTTANAKKVLSANQGVALKALIDGLQTAVDELGEDYDGHTHAIADVSGLQSALDGKAAASHGTHVTYSTTAPVMDGTASAGSAATVARSDHKHPTDTSRASKTEFDTHVADTTAHMTSAQKTQLTTAYNHSQAAHAPSNAQANVIESIKVNGTAQTITSKAVNITVPTKASDIGAASATHSHAISDITNLQTTLNNAASGISTNTSSINALTDRTKALEDKVGDGFEDITSAEIRALFNV